MPNRQRELQAMLQSLHLPMMAEVCAELALKAAKEGLSHEAFLYELARLESERRVQQRIERLLAQSGLLLEKTFATSQLDRLPMPIRTQMALFLTKQGTRLATRTIDDVVRRLGQEAHLSLSAHILRHTCLTSLVRQGNDLVLVAELAGHRRLETTRRYSLPTAADREAVMEGLKVDY